MKQETLTYKQAFTICREHDQQFTAFINDNFWLLIDRQSIPAPMLFNWLGY